MASRATNGAKMTLTSKIFSLSAILFVLLSALGMPTPAMALDITGISPTTIPGGVATEITISGTGFESDVEVTLGGYANPLVITSWSTTSITVIVPADVPAGVYTITANSLLSPPSDYFESLTVTSAPTNTPTPQPTATPGVFGRPQLAVKSYRTNVGEITYGTDFNLVTRLKNEGQFQAYNVQAVFTSSDLIPLENGGVKVVGDLSADGGVDVGQKMRVSAPLYGKTSVLVEMNVTYYDAAGTQYTEKFTLNLPVVATNYVAANTATPTSMARSQLIITSYATDLQPLQPGMQFMLKMNIQNMGNANAKGVTMIVGGGSTGSGSGGTPQPGGVAGGSGEFSNFAPVGSSNVQSLGNLAPGETLTPSQNLIVNVSTSPGAYPLKITLSYTDDKNNIINDEQVITLLVYQLPVLELSFYQPVFSLMAGQPNPLPIQLTNLGKKSAVLGSLKITSNNGRTITKTMQLEVQEAFIEPTPDPNLPPGEGGEFMPGGGGGVAEETFWQKAWRFILGLFGLDSSAPNNTPIEPPLEEPIPAPSGGFKG